MLIPAYKLCSLLCILPRYVTRDSDIRPGLALSRILTDFFFGMYKVKGFRSGMEVDEGEAVVCSTLSVLSDM